MKKIICLLLIALPVYSFGQADFIATFKTDNPGNSSNTSITIPCISASGYQVDVNNDGDLLDTGESTMHTTGFTHDFGATGTYTIRIVGNLDRISFDNTASNDPEKIISVDQWGTASVWTSMENAFYGCTNLSIPATDAPDLSSCGTMNRMFRNASTFNEPIEHWDVSNITLMTDLFRRASSFNQPLNSWDVSNVLWADFLFGFATSFNQPLDAWDVTSINIMSNMFRGATSFNQPLQGWDVLGTPNMGAMFRDATSFNQPLNAWDVSAATKMGNMFRGATNFNQPIDSWDVSNVTVMTSMFQDATNFNQSLASWNVSSVTNMSTMFRGATSFDQPLNGWDISSVSSTDNMFRDATNFDQPLDSWNMAGITNMSNMFFGATSFDQPLQTWDVSSTTNISAMFQGATSFNQPLNGWDITGVSSTNNMFRDATNFDQPLDSWNMTGITNMSNMFFGATSFDQPLDSWNVSNVTNMSTMFRDATSFNQVLDAWNISNVTNMSNMLNSSGIDCANYDATLIGWEAQGVSGVSLGANGLSYDDALAAHNSLTTTYGWTITGDTYTDGCNGPLPIEILSFDAKLKDNIVYLNWQTASEINNKGFEIEHSTNGNNWQNIGFVNGIGTSFELNNYQFLHQSPTSGINYYRLMQKDFDGAFEYSEVVSVSLALSRKLLVVSPNPVQNGTFNLSFSRDDFESGELEIYDSMGHLVRSQTILNTSTEIQTGDFPKGIYLVSLEMNGQRFLKRIIVQ